MLTIRQLDIALTTSCNFHCRYCRGDPGSRKRLPCAEVLTIIDNFCEFGIERIRLDGGEPFLYGPDLFRIVDYAEERKIHVSVFTNASLITNEALERMSRHPDVRLLVTLHTLNPERELAASMDGIARLAARAIFPDLIIVASRGHVPTIRSALSQLPKHRYRVTFRPMIPVGKAYENWDDGFSPLTTAERVHLKTLLDDLSKEFCHLELIDASQMTNSISNGYHSRDDGFVLHVDTEGNLLPSFAAGAERALGSALDKQSIRRRLQSPETRDYLQRADQAILMRITNTERPSRADVSVPQKTEQPGCSVTR